MRLLNQMHLNGDVGGGDGSGNSILQFSVGIHVEYSLETCGILTTENVKVMQRNAGKHKDECTEFSEKDSFPFQFYISGSPTTFNALHFLGAFFYIQLLHAPTIISK